MCLRFGTPQGYSPIPRPEHSGQPESALSGETAKRGQQFPRPPQPASMRLGFGNVAMKPNWCEASGPYVPTTVLPPMPLNWNCLVPAGNWSRFTLRSLGWL